MNKKSTILAVILIGLAAISRLLPHPPNVTPIAAIALFGSFYLNKKWMSFIIPIVALFISDFVLNNFFLRSFYPDIQGIVWWSPIMGYIYGAFILSIIVGKALLTNLKIGKLFSTTLLVSGLFFLVSNFGSWMHFGFYPKSFSGLLACYAAGLPFFLNSILGNLFFVAVMFGIVKVYENQFTQKLA